MRDLARSLSLAREDQLVCRFRLWRNERDRLTRSSMFRLRMDHGNLTADDWRAKQAKVGGFVSFQSRWCVFRVQRPLCHPYLVIRGGDCLHIPWRMTATPLPLSHMYLPMWIVACALQARRRVVQQPLDSQTYPTAHTCPTSLLLHLDTLYVAGHQPYAYGMFQQ